MTAQWADISQRLQQTLESGCFKVWIAPLAAEVADHTLILTAPNGYATTWIRNRLMEPIQQAAAAVLGADGCAVTVEVHTGSPAAKRAARGASVFAAGGELAAGTAAAGNAAAPCAAACPAADIAADAAPASSLSARAAAPAAAAPRMAQHTLPLSTAGAPLMRPAVRHWRYGFEDFVVGPSNEMAVAGAKDLCRQGSVETLFVSAPSGLGKTHLAQAVGKTVSSARGLDHVGYLTAEEFTSRFVAAMRQNDLETFKGRLRDLDVLLLEDVHFLQGKEKMQEHVLSTIKYLQDRGSRVVLTSSFSPRELHKVDSQLVSHFCSGLMTSIVKPTVEMRRTILENKARVHQVILPPTVTDLLADRLSDDVRQMESCLNSLVFKARLLNRSISLDMAWDVLGQYAQMDCGLNFDTIVRLVCESFGLTERQLSSKSRRSEYVLGRNTIYYLARKHTELSLQQIGEKFNRRHSTVIKGITSIEREISNESRVGRQVVSAVTLIERNAGLVVSA